VPAYHTVPAFLALAYSSVAVTSIVSTTGKPAFFGESPPVTSLPMKPNDFAWTRSGHFLKGLLREGSHLKARIQGP
jgi:hypothetical protein